MGAKQDDKRPRRNIRFHERVQFKTIRHVSEFLDDEIRNGWYDKDDFNRMSDEVSEIAKVVKNGETTMNGEVICTRGLEHIIEEELADYRAEKMIDSIDAVLDEQEEQWDEGKEEPESIAKLYAEYAEPLLTEAHEIGLKDAEEGYKDWNDLMEEEDYKKKGTMDEPATNGKTSGKKENSGKSKKKAKKSDDKSKSKKSDDKSKSKKSDDKLKSKKSDDKSKSKKSDDKSKPKKKKVKKGSKRSLLDGKSKSKKEPVPLTAIDEMKEKSCEDQSQQNEEDGEDGKIAPKTEHAMSSSSDEDEKSAPKTPNTMSSSIGDLSISSLPPPTAWSPSPWTSSRVYKNDNGNSSVSSIPLGSSMPLKDTSLKSVKEKEESEQIKELPLQDSKDSNNTTEKKKRLPRRSLAERKRGSEMSPFVRGRDGKIKFRKPDVERQKREQKEKRKSAIQGSLSKFLHESDDDVDYLSGLLGS